MLQFRKTGVLLAAMFALSGCGGGGGGGSSAPTYTVGGVVSGLSGTVVLQNNNGDDLTLTSNGDFTFSTKVASGGAYNVTVKTHPDNQTCTVGKGSGTVVANVGDISIACSATTYTVGGAISGLNGALVLQNNNADDLTLISDGNFTFATALASGAAYNVTALHSPYEVACDVSNGSGTVNGNVNSVNVACASSPWSGIRQMGAVGAGYQTWGKGVASDTHGNVIVAGETPAALDGIALTGNSDGYFTKYDSTGTKKYTRLLGAASKFVQAMAVATDAVDNVIIAGNTNASLDGSVLQGVQDCFVAKYSAAGVKLWVAQLDTGNGNMSIVCRAVATDPSGNIFVSGDTSGAVDSNSQMGTNDLLVAKFNSNGVKQWVRQLGVSLSYTYATAVATDGTDVYVTGGTDKNLDGKINPGASALFIVKFDGAGTKQWTSLLGGSGIAYGKSIKAAGGNVFVAGATNAALPSNTKVGSYDYLVASYTTAGVLNWAKQSGGSGATAGGNGLALDAAGNLYVVGQTWNAVDGQTAVAPSGGSDAFLAKYDSNGARIYTKQFGSSNAGSYATSVVVDVQGNLIVGGDTFGAMGGNIQSGTTDFFVTKFDASGNQK